MEFLRKHRDTLAAALFAGIIIVAGLLAVVQHDDRVMRVVEPQRFVAEEHAAFHPTPEEQRMAAQFADTTLPELRRLGLITRYSRTEAETLITVNGRVWRERSPFFKESLLRQLCIYNQVNGYQVRSRIVDDATEQLYAELAAPDRRIIY